MSENPKKQSQKQDSASTEDAGANEVQQAFDEANEKGYFGSTPDETPNEDYTVQGVVKSDPNRKQG